MLRNLLCLAVLALVATAQDIPAGVKYNLTALTYPQMARFARVQGIVKLELTPNETGEDVKLVSGPPMLTMQARDNVAKWHTNQPLTVNYIYKLVDPEFMKTRVAKGSAFDRFLLRILHVRTFDEQVSCQGVAPRTVGPSVVQRAPLSLDIEVIDSTVCPAPL